MNNEKNISKTEDEVRNEAKIILGFDKKEENVKQGVGQITTFNQLGIKGNLNKPDGWYLPNSSNEPAIILEFKSTDNGVKKQEYVDELFKNIDVIVAEYRNTIGILYDGTHTRVFVNKVERTDVSPELENKGYYINLIKNSIIDRNRIYLLTSKINNEMHFKLGIPDLYNRMIFTACTLAAVKEGAKTKNTETFSVLKLKVKNKLEEIFKDKETKIIPAKFQTLIDVFDDIKTTVPGDPSIINLCKWVIEIADGITSDNWNGEDVMSIFFREFNRYKSKSESGQVFTPENWASFIYRITETNSNCIVIDATAGSGTFLTCAMAKMIKEVGGPRAAKAYNVRNSRLYGIEFDKRIYALCVANMIIHKDGMSNIEHADSLTEEAGEWIAKKCEDAYSEKLKVKVHMNPPYEQKNGCLKIVKNVLDNVPQGSTCAFILPDKKLEKDTGNAKRILAKHTLRKIIKMPENTFDAGITTSIFVFEAGRKQENSDNIFACYIPDDGFKTVKNQGRQDVDNKWQAIEDFWVPVVINTRSFDEDIQKNNIQYFHHTEHLSYQMPETEFEISESDFSKVGIDLLMYENSIDVKEFNNKLLNEVMYNGNITSKENGESISINFENNGENNE